ncbi:MAG: hypothetical protein JWP95_85 [Actinotalea sp.]|nr:hypothetical protein [Actinotalea sp.]
MPEADRPSEAAPCQAVPHRSGRERPHSCGSTGDREDEGGMAMRTWLTSQRVLRIAGEAFVYACEWSGSSAMSCWGSP